MATHSRLPRSILGGFVTALAIAALFVPSRAAGGKHDQITGSHYALIFGTVFDPDGHPVYGVKVKIRRAEEKKSRWELFSDHQGEFAQRVPPGQADYVVWADLKDYKLPSGRHLQPGTEVTVHIYNEERSDIGLHLIW